jgi:hypothetical protein
VAVKAVSPGVVTSSQARPYEMTATMPTAINTAR